MFGQPFNRAHRELRRLVGIGTQDLSIYPDLSARENLRFFGKLYGLGGKDLEARIEDVLARSASRTAPTTARAPSPAA